MPLRAPRRDGSAHPTTRDKTPSRAFITDDKDLTAGVGVTAGISLLGTTRKEAAYRERSKTSHPEAALLAHPSTSKLPDQLHLCHLHPHSAFPGLTPHLPSVKRAWEESSHGTQLKNSTPFPKTEHFLPNLFSKSTETFPALPSAPAPHHREVFSTLKSHFSSFFTVTFTFYINLHVYSHLFPHRQPHYTPHSLLRGHAERTEHTPLCPFLELPSAGMWIHAHRRSGESSACHPQRAAERSCRWL